MGAIGEEAGEPLGGLRYGIRPRDAGKVKAVRAGRFRERFLERVGIAQKSRSA